MTPDTFIASVYRERAETERRHREWQNPDYRAAWWQHQLITLNRAANWQDVRPEDRPHGY